MLQAFNEHGKQFIAFSLLGMISVVLYLKSGSSEKEITLNELLEKVEKNEIDQISITKSNLTAFYVAYITEKTKPCLPVN